MVFTTSTKDLTAIADLGYKARITVGGKDKARFLPSINASFDRKVTDEFYLNVRAADNVKIAGSENKTLATDKAEVETLGRKDRFVLLDDGRLDYQIDILERPPNPWIDLKIKCSPNLVFHHQPELTKAEVEEGCHRPDNIINSYAVTCGKRDNVYQAGKVAHIERSWIRTPGQQIWTQQDIAVKNGAGDWRVMIPPELYAAWPLDVVTVGPVLGYNTEGASTVSGDRQFAFQVTALVAGTTTNFYAYHLDQDSTDWDVGIYTDNSNVPNTLVSHASASRAGTLISGAYSQAFLAETFWLAVGSNIGGNVYLKYDSSTGVRESRTVSSGALPATWTEDRNSTDRAMSMWVEYTAANTALTLGTGTTSDITTTSATLTITPTDADGDACTVTFYDASDDSVIDTDAGVASGSPASVSWTGLTANTAYGWYAIANDGTDDSDSSATVEFETAAESSGGGLIKMKLKLHL